MCRALFFVFVFIAACGSPRESQHVELAQPLPTVTATAQAAPVATARVDAHDTDDVRDLRFHQPRSMPLLQAETKALEGLLSATQTSSPDRPALLRRLAENYVELRKAGDAGASAHAIAYYEELVSTTPAYPQIDDVYYYLALEQETAGDLAAARREYYNLIKNAPASKYVPYAYYAFGELFFREAKSDPSKWMLAQQAYTEVLKFGRVSIASDAACKLGQVFDARGDPQRAASMRARAGRPCG